MELKSKLKMENESIKKTVGFINELEKLETLDNNQIMDYAQWAGRLSSLGYNACLERFFQRFDGAVINSALKKRILNGVNDIKEAFGEYLAVEIFTVQDFCCFVNHAPQGVIDSDVKELLEFWVQTAELQNLDSEAALTLEDYRNSFPIAEEDLLDVIAAPMTARALLFWQNVLEPIDDLIEQNSETLSGRIHIEKTGDASNENLISVRVSGVNPEDVAKVRQRGVPAIRSKSDASVWTFDFSAFGTTFDKQGDIVVQTYDGAQASVPAASIEKDEAPSVGKGFKTVCLFDRRYSVQALAAADDDKPAKHLEFDVEGTNATLDIAIDQNDDRVIVNVYQKGSSANLSDELNGWSFYDGNHTLLGVVHNAFASFKCSQSDGSVELKDANGNSHRFVINE